MSTGAFACSGQRENASRRLAPAPGTSGADQSGEEGLQLQLGFLQLGPGAGAGYDAGAGV